MIVTIRAPLFPRLVFTLALAAIAAGCATEQPEHHHRHRREGGGEGERRGDGPSLFISPAGQPFRAGPGAPYPVAAWFAQADADHDGRLTRSEFREDAARVFRQLDLNGDGVIDGAEVTAYEHDLVPEILTGPAREAGGGARSADSGWGGGGGRHGHGGGGGGFGRRGGGEGQRGQERGPRMALQGAAPYTLNQQTEPVSGADANFDGKVTLAEFLAAADRHFSDLNTAGAGYLTLDALPKTAVQQRRLRRAADRD
jgi:hypothetical protein